MSVVSKTTQGGADFELLCTGAVRNYSFNPADLSGQREAEDIKQKLIAQLEDTVRELELHSDRTIANIYIGKTYIRRNKKYKKFNFNPLNHHTWKKNGISSRWGEHKHKDYGRDGLVVLGAITRETMPERCRGRVHQEDFALAMEQQLLYHYLLSHPDPRVVNESFSTGRTTEKDCIAYAVYMAFRYEDETFSEEEGADTPRFSPNEPDQSTSSAHRQPTTPPRFILTAVSYMNSKQQEDQPTSSDDELLRSPDPFTPPLSPKQREQSASISSIAALPGQQAAGEEATLSQLLTTTASQDLPTHNHTQTTPTRSPQVTFTLPPEVSGNHLVDSGLTNSEASLQTVNQASASGRSHISCSSVHQRKGILRQTQENQPSSSCSTAVRNLTNTLNVDRSLHNNQQAEEAFQRVDKDVLVAQRVASWLDQIQKQTTPQCSSIASETNHNSPASYTRSPESSQAIVLHNTTTILTTSKCADCRRSRTTFEPSTTTVTASQPSYTSQTLTSPKRKQAERANPQLSTGPRHSTPSPSGKGDFDSQTQCNPTQSQPSSSTTCCTSIPSCQYSTSTPTSLPNSANMSDSDQQTRRTHPQQSVNTNTASGTGSTSPQLGPPYHKQSLIHDVKTASVPSHTSSHSSANVPQLPSLIGSINHSKKSIIKSQFGIQVNLQPTANQATPSNVPQTLATLLNKSDHSPSAMSPGLCATSVTPSLGNRGLEQTQATLCQSLTPAQSIPSCRSSTNASSTLSESRSGNLTPIAGISPHNNHRPGRPNLQPTAGTNIVLGSSNISSQTSSPSRQNIQHPSCQEQTQNQCLLPNQSQPPTAKRTKLSLKRTKLVTSSSHGSLTQPSSSTNLTSSVASNAQLAAIQVNSQPMTAIVDQASVLEHNHTALNQLPPSCVTTSMSPSTAAPVTYTSPISHSGKATPKPLPQCQPSSISPATTPLSSIKLPDNAGKTTQGQPPTVIVPLSSILPPQHTAWLLQNHCRHSVPNHTPPSQPSPPPKKPKLSSIVTSHAPSAPTTCSTSSTQSNMSTLMQERCAYSTATNNGRTLPNNQIRAQTSSQPSTTKTVIQTTISGTSDTSSALATLVNHHSTITKFTSLHPVPSHSTCQTPPISGKAHDNSGVVTISDSESDSDSDSELIVVPEKFKQCVPKHR